MSFVEELRRSNQAKADDAAAVDRFNNIMKTFVDSYSENGSVKNEKLYKDKNDLEKKLRNVIKYAGYQDGVLNDSSSDADIARYGSDFLNNYSSDGDVSLRGYLEKKGDKDAVSNWDFIQNYNALKDQRKKERAEAIDNSNGAATTLGLTGLGVGSATGFIPAGLALGALGLGVGAINKAGTMAGEGWKTVRDENKYRKAFESTWGKYGDEYGQYYGNAMDDLETAIEEYGTATPVAKTDAAATQVEKTDVADSAAKSSGDSDDVVTFQLDRANDPNYKGFGQKIIDLGLATNKGLWGSDGDVQFYTKQLYEQGAIDKNGNLKIGVPIKLRRRR